VSGAEMSDAPEDLDTPPPPPPRGGKRPGNGGPPREDLSASAEVISNQDERSVYDWLSEIGTGAVVKIKLIRISPSTWMGHNIRGHIDEFDEPFTEKEIQARFGGGKYQAKTWKANPKGGWQYSGSRTFEIAGDPKVSGEMLHGGGDEGKDPVTPLEGPATARAMNMVERVAEQERKRAERMEEEMRSNRNNSGTDMAMLNAVLEPMRAQMKALNDQLIANQQALADKDERIMALVTRKPESTFQDKLLDKMVDGESARIEGIRENHASELRQLRENHTAELKSARDHQRDELTQRENSHSREIANLERSHASALDGIKLGYEGRIEALKSRIADLEQRLNQLGVEHGALMAKKDKGIVESMEEMATIKNAMEVMGMGGGQEQGSVLERIAMGVLDSSILKAVATRVEQAPSAPPPQPQPTPQQVADMRRRRRAAAAAAGMQEVTLPAEPAAPGAPQPVGQMVPVKKTIKINPGDVKIAINLLEGAYKNGTEPAVFAESARSMVPGDILGAIKQIGVDAFLKDVAKLEDTSPLASMGGRNFLRKVVKYLTDGTTE